MSITCFFFPL